MRVTTPQPKGHPGEARVAKLLQEATERGGEELEKVQKRIAEWEKERKLLPGHSMSYKVGGPGQHGKESRKQRGAMPEHLSQLKKRMLEVSKSLSKRKVAVIREEQESKEKKRAKQAKEDPMPVGHVIQEIGNEYSIRIVYIYIYIYLR